MGGVQQDDERAGPFLRVLKKRVLLQVCGEPVLQLSALLGRILRAGARKWVGE